MTKVQKKNKELCDKYPFLIPLYAFDYDWDTGEYKSLKDFDYNDTWLDSLPDGWRLLAIMMCDEIKKEFSKYDKKYIENYHFIEVKEKYGMITITDSGIPNEIYNHKTNTCRVWDIIHKYSILSLNVCSVCGKPDVPTTNGYIIPLCNDCYDKYYNSKETWEDISKEQSPHRMGEWYIKHNKVDEKFESELKDTAEKYREQYRMECAADANEFSSIK